jgi:hypothetical protein
MTEGPGKYDDIATIVRIMTESKAVIVIVFDGIFGSSFAVQAEGETIALNIPVILRDLADEIEKDMGKIVEGQQ